MFVYNKILMKDQKSQAKESVSPFAQILSKGFALVQLNSTQAEALENLYKEATMFFVADSSTMLRYSIPSRNVGYRPYKYAHTSPDTPDLNDSFLY